MLRTSNRKVTARATRYLTRRPGGLHVEQPAHQSAKEYNDQNENNTHVARDPQHALVKAALQMGSEW
jgi:hypothetical protein